MDNNIGLITRTLDFYKEGEDFFAEWYADIPDYIKSGGLKEDLQMVAGADTLLDIISSFGDKVRVRFSEEPFEDCNEMSMRDKNIDPQFECESGAYYFIDNIDGTFYGDNIWLCDVTMYIFNGKFPQSIYFKVV